LISRLPASIKDLAGKKYEQYAKLCAIKKPTRRPAFSSNKKITWKQKLLLHQLLGMQVLLLHRMQVLLLALQLERMLQLVLERKLLQKLLVLLELLLFCRKQPKRLPTGKRARVIFSCLYFQ